MGVVDLIAPWVQRQMKKKKVTDLTQLLAIKKRATEQEVASFKQLQSKEKQVLAAAQSIVRDMELDMKMTDVEYFADSKKAIFYYSAPARVDFRALVKVFISRFRVRVEMRQIGLREEASRIGGIGICGRELCCATWLSTFSSVTPEAAATQQLPINMQKLSGQCGRLRCCLNYELEAYVAALKDIPKITHSLRTKEGQARLQKVDIFHKI